jgi:hypothetical protein
VPGKRVNSGNRRGINHEICVIPRLKRGLFSIKTIDGMDYEKIVITLAFEV